MELTDPEQKETYRRFFEEQIEKAASDGIQKGPDLTVRGHARDHTKAIGKGQKVYFIAPQTPYHADSYAKQLQQYPEGEKLAAYWHLINSSREHMSFDKSVRHHKIHGR